ncbi:putative F-box protein [Carex littledalei]|uniref:Putative F-box protein n=1 Tax=Carex littledalei TaxID=544730 RepID=A0A833R647_9POAL|nr:putative F-box protein [Carex littledalei]
MGRQRAIPTGEGWMTVVRQHNNKPSNNSYQPPTRRYSNNNRARERQVLHLMSVANWSELPKDILGYLIGFLPLPDYYRFGAVCRNWFTVAREKHYRSAQQLPWLVLGEDIATEKRIFYILSENKHYYIDIPELHGQFVCGSSFGWLFTVDIALNIRMLNPFTRKSYDLPRLDFGHEHFSIKCEQHRLVHKIILDHDPSERSNFTVMLIGSGHHRQVAFWRQGDPTWTSVTLPNGKISDIIFSKGKFYAVGFVSRHQLDIFIVDVGPESKLIPLQHDVPMIEYTYKSLVDLKGKLLLLQWKIDEEEVALTKVLVTTFVSIRKLDFEEGTYSEWLNLIV